eukprot:758314-Hanusia_phi.AAC.4
MLKVQEEIPPNQTLYIRNINEKYSKKFRLEELKAKLKAIFRPYGEILDIVAMSNFYNKGQAFVAFRDVSSATKAMNALQGHTLSLTSVGGGKQMKISYARSKSDVIAKLEGTFEARTKKTKAKPPTGKKVKKAKAAEGGEGEMEEDAEQMDEEEDDAESKGKTNAHGGWQASSGQNQKSAPAAPVHTGPLFPHPILFLENLPLDITSDDVAAVFSPFPGFKEVRLVPSRPGIAFVEYESEMQSGMAMARLQGHRFGEFQTKIAFSKA